MVKIDRAAFAKMIVKDQNADRWLDAFEKYAKGYDLNTAQRCAAFWGQCLHETGKLRWLKEIWGPTAQQLKYEPGTKLAKQLGNVHPGDGKLFMGRGLIQTTGRANYEALARKLKRPDIMKDPELLCGPDLAILSALVFWHQKGLNEVADTGDIKKVSKLVNGGTNGLEERIEYTNNLLKVFKDV